MSTVKNKNWHPLNHLVRLGVVLFLTLLALGVSPGGFLAPHEADAAISELSTWATKTGVAASGGTTTVISTTVTIPAGSGANRVLVTGFAFGNAVAATSTCTATYGGQGMTVAVNDGAVATVQHSYLFYLAESKIDLASSTTLTITCVNSTSYVRLIHIYSNTFDNVDQGSPISRTTYSTFGTTTGTPYALTVPLTINSGEWAVGVVNGIRVTNTSARTITMDTTSGWVAEVGPNQVASTDSQGAYMVRNTTAGSTSAAHNSSNASTLRTHAMLVLHGIDAPEEVLPSLSVTPEYGDFVDSPITITELFSSSSITYPVVSCQTTTNGATSWFSGTVSGASPGPYTCTASNIAVRNGATLDIRMRASTDSGSTWSTVNQILTRTVDTAAPTDGAAPTVSKNAASGTLMDVSWSAASDGTGAGLSVSAPYKVVRALGAVAPAANCTDTAVYTGAATNFTDSGLSVNTQYTYRVCAYDVFGHGSAGVSSSGTTTAGVVKTTLGSLTFPRIGGDYIQVRLAFNGDDNGDNTCSLEYGTTLSYGSTASPTRSPSTGTGTYTAMVSGLSSSTLYYFRETCSDPDGTVGGTQVTGSQATLSNPMLHNSSTTVSTKWTATNTGWGLAGKTYGEFTCQTCHARSTSNIKRIKNVIATPDGGKWATSGTSTVAVTFLTTTGMGDDTAHATSQRVCQACHSLVTGQTYSSTGVVHNGTKDCITCHDHNKGFKAPNCIDCHSTTINSVRSAAADLLQNANSHHVQNGATKADQFDCAQCHWEGDPATGKVNNTYHTFLPDQPVSLVVWTLSTRPSNATAATLTTYLASAQSRTEMARINKACLGCHGEAAKDAQPFSDGKTPRWYAWDATCSNTAYNYIWSACVQTNSWNYGTGSSVASRYSSTATTKWGKYTTAPNAADKDITKALSAHGSADLNARGWDTVTGNDFAGQINTSGTEDILCIDCHNSHGSNASGIATSYTSSLPVGGILKNVIMGIGGSQATYTPMAGGDPGENNVYSTGAAICFDCHMNKDASSSLPWGYSSTYNSSQRIMGYMDTPWFGTMAYNGAQNRYSYKQGRGRSKGGHFGASSNLTSSTTTTIRGLCTPCHDPHGISSIAVSSTNSAYAVPLLKGTWMTSPYLEDAAPAGTAIARGGGSVTGATSSGSDPGWHIDQNTFQAARTNYRTPALGVNETAFSYTFPGTGVQITQTDQQFGGLCLQCHARTAIQTTTLGKSWKTRDRVHNAVEGWAPTSGVTSSNLSNAVHAYTCSKCHTPHNSPHPRLMITNCLDFKHRGRVGSGGTAGGNVGGATGVQVTGVSGRGNGRFPGGGGGFANSASGKNWSPAGNGGAFVAGIAGASSTAYSGYRMCHDSAVTAGSFATWPTVELWNSKTPW